MSGFLGAPLALESVTQTGASTVRVRFTNFPQASNSSGANDATNSANYTLTGPAINTITEILPVSGDPQAVDVYLRAPLIAGQWTLAVANIQTPESNTLVAPTVINFPAILLAGQQPLSQGAEDEDEEKLLRGFLNPAFAGPGWDALVAALAIGDTYRSETAAAAFDQLFKSTASGVYLDRRAADDGFSRPGGIGIDDEVFRKLAIKTTARKQVIQVILESLEAFYGSPATRASITTTLNEPYALRDGDTLIISIEGDPITVTFDRDDFAQLGAAKALECAAVITSTLAQNGSSAYAIAVKDPSTGNTSLSIFSGALGLKGQVAIQGGRSNNVFKFPLEIHPPASGLGPAVGTTWNVTVGTGSNGVPSGNVRFTWTGGTSPDLIDVNVGDYVNVFGVGFFAANQGAFPIIATTTTTFDIQLLTGVNQTGVVQAAADDVKFFRPKVYTIQSQGRMATATQGSPGELDVILPATTQAVTRGPGTGAYLHSATPVVISSASRNSAGLVTVVAPAHGIPVDSNTHGAFIDGLVPVVNTIGAAGWSNADVLGLSHNALASCQLLDGRVLTVLNNSASLYTPSTGLWTAVAGPNTSRNDYPAMVTMTNGKVLCIGGASGGLSSCEIYDPISNTWTATGSMTSGRAHMSAVLLGDGTVMVSGGNTTAQDEIYNPVTASWTQTGTSPGVNYNFGVTLRDGSALFGGGINNISQSQTACFVYNPINKTYKTSNMITKRGLANACLMNIGTTGRVLVAGGDTIGDSTGKTALCEVYDPATNTWSSVANALGVGEFGSLLLMPNGTVLYANGVTSPTCEFYDPVANTWSAGPTMLGTNNLLFCGLYLVNGSQVLFTQYNINAQLYSQTIPVGGGKINGLRWVTATDANTLTFTTENCFVATTFNCTKGTVTPIAANTNTNPGPFIYDPDGNSPSVTSVESTVSTALVQGENFTVITLANASAFPDAPGYLCFGWATSLQLSPVRYFGRVSSTQLLIDPSFTFPITIPPGTKCTLVTQRGPFIPAQPTEVGSFYITGAASGRVAAEATIGDLTAAGLNITTTVVYPSDIGLGNQGAPDSGAPKISDRVEVWGSDDLDTEIPADREA